jgi:hypothetical protein
MKLLSVLHALLPPVELRENVKGYVDRRGPRELAAARALEQARLDRAIEEEWNRRVRDNAKEIRRVMGGGEPTC